MMKKLLFILLLFPAIGFGQEKGDTKIVVTIKDTTNLLNRLSAVLYDRGYDIHTKDASVGFISTEEKRFKTLWVVKNRFLIKGNTLIISGEVAVFDTNANKRLEYDPIDYRSGIFGTFKPVWEELEEIGRLFGALSYSR